MFQIICILPAIVAVLARHINDDASLTDNIYLKNDDIHPYSPVVAADYVSWENDEDSNGFDDYYVKSENDVNYFNDQGIPSRRIFDWFTNLFKPSTPSVDNSSTPSTNYTKELKQRIFLNKINRNLSEVIVKLSDVQRQLAIAIESSEATRKNRGGYRRRFIRDVSDMTVKPLENDAVDKNLTSDIDNSTNRVTETTTKCASGNTNLTNGRRSASTIISLSEVKNKLLRYLDESFREINAKIASLKNVKQYFSDNKNYKIGYIMANIDALELNMLNLKRSMNNDKNVMNSKNILDLYDTLRLANQAVSGLIESLSSYIGTSNNQAPNYYRNVFTVI